MKKAIKRYDHVKAILNQAAGDQTDLYGSDVPFWELPYDEFLKSEVYGVRMIAEASRNPDPVAPNGASDGDCCCSKKSATVNVPSVRGRDSGLIRGLRGEPPFDGKPFARLPWGGKEVASDDILFIQDWIDDGCPKDETLQTLDLSEDVSLTEKLLDRAPAQTSENYRTYAQQVDLATLPGNKRIRMNLDCLPHEQVEVFRHGLRLMYDLNKYPADWRNYNSLALIHQNHCQHAWERFLPWHRVYLYEFERALNDLIGHSFGIPYWDWTMPQYKDGSLDGDIIPKSCKAFLTDDSIRELSKTTELSKTQLKALQQDVVGKLFTSQRQFFEAARIAIKSDPFQYRRQFIQVLLKANALWYPLRYPAEFFQKKDGEKVPTSMAKKIGYHYPSIDDIAQIQSLNSFRDYGGGSKYDNSYGFLDQNPHNTIHIWSGGENPNWDGGKKGIFAKSRNYDRGDELYDSEPQYGDMFSNLTAAFDPIFWPHHVNVDRLWAEWQINHPNGHPVDDAAILTPWNYTAGDTMDHTKFGYEYLKSCHHFPVGKDEPLQRFVSQKVNVPAAARKKHDSVEIRLHQVPQLPLSCYIRAFINQPDANAHTELDNNPNYAGFLAIFGHGQCYGGPGHCDIPPDQPAPYDLREQMLHNRPRNHRIDATACIDALIQDGAKDFQITLVVVGVDGEEMQNFLRLDSVSLNFKD